MTCPGPFASISMRGPLGHVVTLRASGVEVEAHAPTRGEAEEDAALALTRAVRQQQLAARYPRGQHLPLRRRP